MLIIDDVLVTDGVLQNFFVCNLEACKGACCVEGDGGAPLTEEEAMQLDDNLEAIAPYMDPIGLEVAREQGAYETDPTNELETSLVNGRECVFAYYDEQRVLKCAVETANKAGAIPFMKPLSCHLYPIRVVQNGPFQQLHYHQWGICSPACSFGAKLNVPVYQFLKEPLVRAYGEEWFAALEENAQDAE